MQWTKWETIGGGTASCLIMIPYILFRAHGHGGHVPSLSENMATMLLAYLTFGTGVVTAEGVRWVTNEARAAPSSSLGRRLAFAGPGLLAAAVVLTHLLQTGRFMQLYMELGIAELPPLTRVVVGLHHNWFLFLYVAYILGVALLLLVLMALGRCATPRRTVAVTGFFAALVVGVALTLAAYYTPIAGVSGRVTRG